jgi:hypothetical protein
MRTFLTALLLCAIVAIAGQLRAEEPVTFPIDSVSVEGLRYASPAIIIAESKLEAGSSYTEPQLRDAMSRITRLPFVVHADFRLAKGSERGHYVLVIDVVEAMPLFVSYRALHEGIDTHRVIGVINDPVAHQPIPIYEKALFRHNEDASTFGLRMFTGSRGVLHAATDRGGSRFSIGYTQYDLFGTGASVSALVQYREYGFDFPPQFGAAGRADTSFTDHLGFQLTGAVPLRGNNAIRASWYRERFPYTHKEPTAAQPDGQILITREFDDQVELAWVHDTTDDPVFPTDGTYLKAAFRPRRVLKFEELPGNGNYKLHSDWNREVNAHVGRYWSVTPRQSFHSSADLLTINDRAYQEYTLVGGYTADLWRSAPASDAGQMRFEAELERNLLHYGDAGSYGKARLGLAFRNRWGVARLDFQYIGWRH